MSELSILPSDEKGGTDWHTSPTSAAIADSPTTKPQIAKKRKREVLDYVLIPSFLKRQPAASLLATNGQRSHSVEAVCSFYNWQVLLPLTLSLAIAPERSSSTPL